MAEEENATLPLHDKEVYMHVLHKILVYIPSMELDLSRCARSELVKEIRSCAEGETDSFAGEVYDWRETTTAGGWSADYPENVLFAEDDIDRFVNELLAVRKQIDEEIKSAFQAIEKEVGTDELGYVADIIRGYEITDKTINEGIPNQMASYWLLRIGKLLHGEYCISSGFYNTFNYDANIYSVDMDTIRQKPEDWALVMFDYHF